MSEQHHTTRIVEERITDAQRSLNRSRCTVWALRGTVAAGGTLALALTAVIASGRAAPLWAIILGVAAAIAIALIGTLSTRVQRTEAAAALDDRLALRDGTKTALSFAHSGGSFEQRQREWTAAQLRSTTPQSVASPPSRRLVSAGIMIPVLVLVLALVPESAAVREARAEAEQTIELSKLLNEGLKEELERAIDETPDHALEHLDPDRLREQAQELQLTPEREELLKQFSTMEREVSASADALTDARRERLIDAIADALASASETKSLSDALRSQDLANAAAQLGEFSASKETPKQDNLPDVARKLDRLSKLSTRLAEAARKFEASDASADHTELDEWSQSMAQDAQELEAATEEAQRSLGDCQNGECTNPELAKLARASERSDQALERISRRLQDEDGRRRARATLSQLRNTLAQCQSAAAGQLENPFERPRAGAGTSRAQNQDETPAGGQLTSLSGQQGQGPSRTRRLDASTGDGRASTAKTQRSEEYARQLESFIKRTDVPWELKDAVKTYFETLNQTPPPAEQGQEP